MFNFNFTTGKQENVLTSIKTVIIRGGSVSTEIVPAKKLFIFDRSTLNEEDKYSQFACKAKDFPELERVSLYDNGTGGQFSIGDSRYCFSFVNKEIISVSKR